MDFNWSSLKNLRHLTSHEIRESLLNLPRWILIIWIAINIIFPGYGVLIYYWQYAYYHPAFWIFIPDSNTFAILFGIFLIVTLGYKKNIQVLNVITFIGLIKAFFGYIVVFSVQPSFFDLVSLTAHTFELCEASVLLLFMKVDLKNFQVASFIHWIDWFFDFNPFPFSLPTLALYPVDEINPDNTAPFIGVFAVVFTIVILLTMAYIRLKHWVDEGVQVKWIDDLPDYYTSKLHN